jgi:hypothetical protein
MKSKLVWSIVAAMTISGITATDSLAQIKPLTTKRVISPALQKKFLNPRIQPQTEQNQQKKEAVLNSFKFNGQMVKVSQGLIARAAELKTVRNGRTTEVVANDGNLGVQEVEGSSNTVTENGSVCTVQQVTLTAGFNELNLLDPSAAEIWPGRIINIATMDEGAYQSFTNYTSRKDLSIALVSAGTSQGSVVKKVAGTNVTQGMVIEQVNSIKNSFGSNSFGSQGWMFEDIRYSNMEQFSIEAGLGVIATPINLDIRATSGAGNGTKKNKIVLKFLRDAFTIKVDNDLNDVVVADNLSNNAGIIATVTYGSFGIVEIESDSSFSNIEATLNAAFQAAPGTAVDANMTLEQKKTMSSMSIKGIFKGVDGNQSLRNSLTLDGVRSILTNEVANFTATTPVVPIAFGIKSLKTGETMMLRTTMTYPRRNCIPQPEKPADLRVRIKMIAFTCPEVNDGVSSDEDIYGKIIVTNGNRTVDVWEKPLSANVKVKKSVRPADDGAYSLNGRATDFVFTMPTDATSLSRNEITVRVELYDEEWNKGVPYEFRTIRIKHKDIFSVLKSPTVTPPSIDWDATEGMFKLITNERGNTNKIVTWFDVFEE